jgi:ABC-type iron transport system FetAB permease component
MAPVLGEIGGLPQSVMNDISTISDNVELMAYLDEKVDSMITLLLTVCQEENKLSPQHTSLFETFFSVIQNQSRVDFMLAKDTVVQEVHAIQNETEMEDESNFHPPSKLSSD